MQQEYLRMDEGACPGTCLRRWRAVSTWLSVRQLAALLVMVLVAVEVHAAEDASHTTASADQSQGLLPVPDYGGDIWGRDYLTGDWGGTRTDWANKGVQFGLEYLQWI